MKKKENQLTILNRGVQDWNRWRREHPEEKIEICDAYVATKSLNGINLKNAKLEKLDLKSSSLSWANLSGSTLSNCLLDQSDFSNSDLQGAKFENCRLSESNFSRSNLERASFDRCDLQKSNLSNSNMQESDFSKSDLSQANLENSDLAFSHLFDATLLQSNLANVNLLHAFLYSANFDYSNLSQAKIIGANLTNASLRCANLQSTDLQSSILVEADLSGASLCNANLTEANLRRSNLKMACFKNTILWETILSDLDLSEVDSLTECHHLGPSIIDHRTLIKSRNLSQKFLLDVGLPNILIANLMTLKKSAFQRCSCFIYYSKSDESFVARMHSDLQKHGIRCWNIDANSSVSDSIRWKAMSGQDKLILIISSNLSFEPSIKKQFDEIREREKKGCRVLFPIIIDESLYNSEDGWVKLMSTSESFVNFSKWNNEDFYQKCIKELADSIQKSF